MSADNASPTMPDNGTSSPRVAVKLADPPQPEGLLVLTLPREFEDPDKYVPGARYMLCNPEPNKWELRRLDDRGTAFDAASRLARLATGEE